VSEQIASCRRELEISSHRIEKDGSNPDHHLEIAIGLVQLAELLGRSGRLAEAVTSVDEAVASLESLSTTNPDSRPCRQALALALEVQGRIQSRAGRPPAARDSAEKAVAIAQALGRLDPTFGYDLACALDLRSELTHSEVDARAAIEALRRAIAAGFDDSGRLSTDPRLAWIHSRPDFATGVGLGR
jgi:hypothetical protein